jgi:hypothetical protein
MNDLIEKITSETGITSEQAWKTIEILKDYAKSKYPLFGGAIDKAFDKYRPKEEEDFLA